MSEYEYRTPAPEPGAVLNHSETDAAIEVPMCRSGRVTRDEVPLNVAAVVELPASGPAVWPSVTLAYVALSAPSLTSTALAAVVPDVSASGQNDWAPWSRV